MRYAAATGERLATPSLCHAHATTSAPCENPNSTNCVPEYRADGLSALKILLAADKLSTTLED